MGGTPWLEPWAWRLALVLLAAGIMTLGVRSRRWKSSLTLALGIGLAFRVAVVALFMGFRVMKGFQGSAGRR